MSPKGYRRMKLSRENAERLANGLPPKAMRGRFGIHFFGIGEAPQLVDVHIARYRTEEVEGLEVQRLARGKWWFESLCHLPMEGGAGKAGMIRSKKMKAQGARAGTSDYVLAIAQDMKDGRRMGSLWIELKASDGKPTEDQKKFGQRVMCNGQAFCFAYGADAVLQAIELYLKGEWP